jgi:hypothetical protein
MVGDFICDPCIKITYTHLLVEHSGGGMQRPECITSKILNYIAHSERQLCGQSAISLEFLNYFC